MKKAIALAPDSWMPGRHARSADPSQARPDRRADLAHRRPAQGVRARPRSRPSSRSRAWFTRRWLFSTIAQGRIATLDTAAAEAAPGVVLVMTYRNAPRLKPMPLVHDASRRPPAATTCPIMQDDRIHWNGQPVAWCSPRRRSRPTTRSR